DEATLKAAGLSTDGASLVNFFRKRSLTEADLDKLRELIKKLGDDEFKVREQATEDLLAAGRLVIPLLKEAVNDPGLEISRRAERCLEQLEKSNDAPVVLAAARLLGAKKPAGAAEVILVHLPFVEDPLAEEELITSLAATALTKGKADEVVVKALS